LGGVLNQVFLIYGRPKGSALLGVTFIACAAVFAWLAERYFDRPVRRWLTGLDKSKSIDRAKVAAGAR
jgi:peptidoglycan/LPS O-acetylase OafA/YrhL